MKEEILKVFSLASGSHGNCTFVKYGKTSILIDAGISYEKIKKTLQQRGENVEDICAILVSHEHCDHTCGLEVFVKKQPKIKIYAHEEVCTYLKYHKSLIKNNLIDILMPVFYVGDLTVSVFNLPHDSVACFGYSLMAEDKKFSIATDLGVVSDSAIEAIYDSNVIFLESNHSLTKIKECNKYSFLLKERILGDRGHLSNKMCGETMVKILEKRKMENLENPIFVLCHQSKNTNSQEDIVSEVGQILINNNMEIEYFIATQETGTKEFLI